MNDLPLIPANAGTQMEKLWTGLDARSASRAERQRLAIWVPAFAGMSGRGVSL